MDKAISKEYSWGQMITAKNFIDFFITGQGLDLVRLYEANKPNDKNKLEDYCTLFEKILNSVSDIEDKHDCTIRKELLKIKRLSALSSIPAVLNMRKNEHHNECLEVRKLIEQDRKDLLNDV